MLAINSLRAPISFCCLVLFSALAFAQSAELPPAPPEDRTSGWSATGPVTTGSPFCADFVVGTSKDLANGSLIERNTTKHFCRDSQGRRRIEAEATPGVSRGMRAVKSITISDPTTRTIYVLYPDKLIATKSSWRPVAKVSSDMSCDAVLANVSSSSATGRCLGERTFDGIKAIGTLVTRTIPAGTIGNPQPIVMSKETWHSPELQLSLLTKANDRRNGVAVRMVENIVRREPSPSLFEIPADYTIVAPGSPAVTGAQP